MPRWMVPVPVVPVDRTPLGRVVEPLAFWSSVLLPFAYVPLLYGGFGEGQPELFVGLVALNVLCLVLGHEHRR